MLSLGHSLDVQCLKPGHAQIFGQDSYFSKMSDFGLGSLRDPLW